MFVFLFENGLSPGSAKGFDYGLDASVVKTFQFLSTDLSHFLERCTLAR